MRICYIAICGQSGFTVSFPMISQWVRLLKIGYWTENMWLISSTKFQIFFTLRRTEWDMIKMCIWSLRKVIVIFVWLLLEREFSRRIFEKYWNIKFHENPSSGSWDVTCGQTDMTKLIVAFRKLMKTPQNVCLSGRVSLQTAYPACRSECFALLACLSTAVQLDCRLCPTPMESGRAGEEGDPCLVQELNGCRLARSWAHGGGDEPLLALLLLFVLTDALLIIFRKEKTFYVKRFVNDFLTWTFVAANAHSSVALSVEHNKHCIFRSSDTSHRSEFTCF